MLDLLRLRSATNNDDIFEALDRELSRPFSARSKSELESTGDTWSDTFIEILIGLEEPIYVAIN